MVSAIRMYVADMQLKKLSDRTIQERIAILDRFEHYLGRELEKATKDDIRSFQQTFVHLAPASVNIYSRNIKAFFDWAYLREVIEPNPARGMTIPRVPRRRPHPTQQDDVTAIFAATRGALRVAYMLAAFAGLRCGEIVRLERIDCDLSGQLATAIIHGKGGKERLVPLLRPVVTELESYGLPRAGRILRKDGRPYEPKILSLESSVHLRRLGVESTLHSLRHSFATNVARMTRDPLFVRDLLGHESVKTTEIYMDSDAQGAHLRLAGLATFAGDMLGAAATLGQTA